MTLKSKNRLVLSFVSLCFTLIPVACVYLSATLSDALNCTVNEASSSGCLVFGIDIGDLLYTLFVSGWLGIITFPVGGLATIVFFVLALNSWNDTETT